MKTQNPQKYKSLRILPFPGIENAYVVISARESSEKPNGVYQNISYIYDLGNGRAIEWELQSGLFTVLYECTKDHEQAKDHWFFEHTIGQGNWSQCAVDDSGIALYFAEGNYEMMFHVLSIFGE